MRIGFVGTGVISAAVIEGLCRVPEGETAPEIIVSPRSEKVGRDLTARHPNVRRAKANQDVVDGSDVICMGVLPSQLPDVLRGLHFRDAQIIVSFVAGADLEDVAAHVDAKPRICRVVPLPMIARREGPVLLYPAIPEIRDLLAPLGTLIEPANAAKMMAFAHGGALMSSFFAMANAGVAGLGAHGVPRDGARDYLMAMYRALAATGQAAAADALDDLPARHETPGGVNEACRAHLSGLGWFDAYRGAIDAVARKTETLAG